MTYRIRLTFDAAHKLEGYPESKGKCGRLHGHTWRVEFRIEGPEYRTLDAQGIGHDFGDLKNVLRELLPDHEFLNDFMRRIQPSAENVARMLLARAREKLWGSDDTPRPADSFDGKRVWVKSLELWESDSCAVEVE